MDNPISSKAFKYFSDLAKNEKLTLTEVSGRSEQDQTKERLIYQDIRTKIHFKSGDKVLDIGCGASQLANYLVETALELNLDLTFVDADDVLVRLQKDLGHYISDKELRLKSKIDYVSGYFPACKKDLKSGYDKILLYSMIHYTEDPLRVIKEAMSLLSSGGELIVGDIPNINKKGRFLSSEFGSKFDCSYRGVPYEGGTLYRNQFDFISKNQTTLNMKISDLFILEIIKYAREDGFEAFVVDQPTQLPFSFTREDIVIYNRKM